MYKRLKKAWFMLIELILRIVIHPALRAYLLRLSGAKIGRNVRIYEIQLFNLENGFKNLSIQDDVHIGMGCRIDLEGFVIIERGTTLSPGITLLTHADPGSQHHSPICHEFKPFIASVKIGPYCWIGSNTTILPGTQIHDKTVVGACSLVRGTLQSSSLYYGIPVKKIRALNFNE
jgi:acetyltransferase-like isoleucine patch superfamily enzyme